MKMSLTRSQRWNAVFVALAIAVYLGLTLTAPPSDNPNPYHLPIAVVVVVTVTILALWMAICFYGYDAWRRLDTYAQSLPSGEGRRAYHQMAGGVRVLAYGLLVSSVLGASKSFFAHDLSVSAVIGQINYYIILAAPFLGFLWLRMGSKRLAVSAEAAMSWRTKLVTVGPPVVLLAGFYSFLIMTNPGADVGGVALGPLGFLMLPLDIAVVVSSWVLGLLAALNIERATHHEGAANQTRPLVKLYNGILMMTGGFIILDALLSLGNDRIASLPLGIVVALLYIFVGVVALGFFLVAMSARALLKSTVRQTETH